ncbi:TIGR00269 family protein [Candidatus Pacearchaeota archaeon ex4484_31]|nr:MAG: TIGR00269 family protein [Candidatus Pacearchaeota archaeon ex4484_31]
MRCCKNKIIIEVNGNKFCKKHFISYYERKVEKIFRRYLQNKKVVVAVSGGKDSMTVAFLAKKFESILKSLELLFVDVGIKGYSEKARSCVAEFAKENKMNLNVIKLEEFGFTIDELAKIKKRKKIKQPLCSICGLAKRYIINKFAYENSYDFIVTGHNLDDEVAFLFNNLSNQNVQQALRTDIALETRKELRLVGKVKPLYFLQEKENLMYAKLRKINFFEGRCPYSEKATQLKMKKAIEEVEKVRPGFKLNVIKSFLKVKKRLALEKEKIRLCKVCGYATTSEICSFCRLKERLKKLKH